MLLFTFVNNHLFFRFLQKTLNAHKSHGRWAPYLNFSDRTVPTIFPQKYGPKTWVTPGWWNPGGWFRLGIVSLIMECDFNRCVDAGV